MFNLFVYFLFALIVAIRERPRFQSLKTKKEVVKPSIIPETIVPTIDTFDYNKRMLALANNDTTRRWPVKKNFLFAARYDIAVQQDYFVLWEFIF